jgi:hypothetical protein
MRTVDADKVLKQGHGRNSIHNVKNGIFTRGSLIDKGGSMSVSFDSPASTYCSQF